VARTKRSLMAWSHPVSVAAIPRFRPILVLSNDEASASKGSSQAVRLLVVEDDYLVGSQVAYALEDEGFVVAAVVTSAEEAIEFTRCEPIALAIMDVRLAGERDGVDCALELFREHGIRCIFATAHSDEQIKARAEPAQPLAWIQKPYSMASLIASVRKTLDSLE